MKKLDSDGNRLKCDFGHWTNTLFFCCCFSAYNVTAAYNIYQLNIVRITVNSLKFVWLAITYGTVHHIPIRFEKS